MKNIINSIIHPTTRRTSKRLPMPENVRKGFRRYSRKMLSPQARWHTRTPDTSLANASAASPEQ